HRRALRPLFPPLMKPTIVRALAIAAVAAIATSAAHAQQTVPPGTRASGTVTLSLDDALRIAQSASQTIDIARAGVTRATGSRYQARSQFFPQLNGTAGYTRTLKSQFQSFSTAPAPDTATGPRFASLCAPDIPANATPEQRAAAIA